MTNYSPPNYMRSRDLSMVLCEMLVDFYKDNPAYPSDFWTKIKTQVYRNPSTGDFYVRSNLNELFMNVVDLEEKYS